MNLPRLVKRVMELAPGLQDVHAEANGDGRTGYVVATKDGRMRCSFWDRGHVVMQRSEEQIAQEVAKEMST
jgi:hypothetical protein